MCWEGEMCCGGEMCWVWRMCGGRGGKKKIFCERWRGLSSSWQRRVARVKVLA